MSSKKADPGPGFQPIQWLLQSMTKSYYKAWKVLQNVTVNTFSFIFSTELFCSASVTVTQGSSNVPLLFPSKKLTLLLRFESLLTHSHNYVVWTATYFFFRFLNGTVPFLLCNCNTRSLNIFPLFPSGHSRSYFLYCLMIRSHNRFLWMNGTISLPFVWMSQGTIITSKWTVSKTVQLSYEWL